MQSAVLLDDRPNQAFCSLRIVDIQRPAAAAGKSSKGLGNVVCPEVGGGSADHFKAALRQFQCNGCTDAA